MAKKPGPLCLLCQSLTIQNAVVTGLLSLVSVNREREEAWSEYEAIESVVPITNDSERSRYRFVL